MASRRQPPRPLPYDEAGITTAWSEDDHDHDDTRQTPTFTAAQYSPRKSNRPRVFRFTRTSEYHPVLSTFGPSSLQDFLKNELEKQRCEQSEAQYNPYKAELLALQNKAKALINANSNLSLVGERGKKEFKVEKPSPRRRLSRRETGTAVREYGSEDEAATLNSLSVTRRRSTLKNDSGIANLRRSNTPGLLDGSPFTRRISSGVPSPRPRRTLRQETTVTNPYHAEPNESVLRPVVGASDLQPQTSRTLSVSHSHRLRGHSQPNTPPRISSLRAVARSDRQAFPSPVTLEPVAVRATAGDGHASSWVQGAPSSTPVVPTNKRRFSQPTQGNESKMRPSNDHRSLSFEKYADEQRKSKRTFKNQFQPTSEGSSNTIQVEKESMRPRKAPSGRLSLPLLDPVAKPFTPNSGTAVFQEPSALDRPGDQAMSEIDVAVPWSHAKSFAEVPNSGNSTQVKLESGDHPQLLSQSLPGRNSYRIDKDTFLTGSSDDCDSDGVPESLSNERLNANANMQQAILASLLDSRQSTHEDTKQISDHLPRVYDYSKVIPEQMPINLAQAERNRSKIWQAHGFDANGKFSGSKMRKPETDVFPTNLLDPTISNILSAPDGMGNYPRTWEASEPAHEANSPPICLPTGEPRNGLPSEIWEEGVLEYLSSSEVRNLRLVCKSIAEELAPYVFRNVVTNFSPSMFNLDNGSSWSVRHEPVPAGSMLEKYGTEINKFGISFEYDQFGLAHAPAKVTEKLVQAWYGDYKWPVKDYPYFKSLKEIDDLLDDERRLLTSILKKLPNCSELALSLDSGHGWLTGPDTSDVQLYKLLSDGGSKVFGKTFPAEDRWHAFGLREYFKWAQMNTVNEGLKLLHRMNGHHEQEEQILRAITVRDYDSYRVQSRQPDFERYAHTGGKVGITNIRPNPQNLQNLQAPPQGQLPGLAAHGFAQPAHLTNGTLHGNQAGLINITNRPTTLRRLQSQDSTNNQAQLPRKQPQTPSSIQPQWPIIFNGYNIAADSRGHYGHIQEKTSSPASHPLHPGYLEEAQAQWLLETSWIQRTFLSAYTDAVRVNALALKGIHSLHISKISSGLLPSLGQEGFWTALPNLRKVTLLVNPDWREEHTPGDKFWHRNMAIIPVTASLKLAEILRTHIARLENLYTVTVGFTSGGEHQPGIFGRNQHVLPAPITFDPFAWLTAHKTRPDVNTMFTFNHIRTLKFENCWFSPAMLETFMTRSRDTSLHHLILDSVSLTGTDSSRTDGPLQTVLHNLKCDFSASEWLQENVPPSACWVNLIDKITPGRTLLDRKYDADMIDTEAQPRPEKEFRGNVQRITLKSCGYVKISGISTNDLNQNNVVVQNSMWSAMDDGLRARMNSFRIRASVLTDSETNNAARNNGNRSNSTNISDFIANGIRDGTWSHVMLSYRASDNEATIGTSQSNASNNQQYLLGRLTQCVHPIEKRVLEHAWGMRFGWGDIMERWGPVDDGWFEGGTGRFSGEISADDSNNERGKGKTNIETNMTGEDAVRDDTEEEENNDNTNGRNTGVDGGGIANNSGVAVA